MDIQDSINLFNTKINQTYWTPQIISPKGKPARKVPNPVVLDENNYYKILQKKFIKVGENSGETPDLDTVNFAEYYANTKTNETIAVVNSTKIEESIPVKISIATYYNKDGDIAILNRFDQIGRPHDNYFHVYGKTLSGDELEFYKSHLVDVEKPDPVTGQMHYYSLVPHIHFNTKSQTVAFSHHDKANAISIRKLIEYLNELKSDFNPSSMINTIDMGMPFLDLKKAKLEYTSTMLDDVNQIINYFDMQNKLSTGNFSQYQKDTIDLMKSLINIDSGSSNAATTAPTDGDSPDGGTPTSPTSGSGSPSTGGSTTASSGSASSAITSRLTEQDFEYILTTLPSLDGLTTYEIAQVKNHISKHIKQIEGERKYKKETNQDYSRQQDFEVKEQLSIYKDYLKYAKGLLNLETMLVDLNKYMQIYEVINERDPLLMTFISRNLLENLTINIKPVSGFDKGGVANEHNAKQPQ